MKACEQCGMIPGHGDDLRTFTCGSCAHTICRVCGDYDGESAQAGDICHACRQDCPGNARPALNHPTKQEEHSGGAGACASEDDDIDEQFNSIFGHIFNMGESTDQDTEGIGRQFDEMFGPIFEELEQHSHSHNFGVHSDQSGSGSEQRSGRASSGGASGSAVVRGGAAYSTVFSEQRAAGERTAADRSSQHSSS